MLRDINDTLEGLSKSLTDTVFIITSNHGMTDISSEIMLNLQYDLLECLVMPPTFGGRAVNFFVKYDRRSDFERLFARDLSVEFLLMPRSEVLRRELFGNGRTNPRIYDFLGDYIAFAIGSSSLKFRALNEKHRAPAKAAGGGITTDEMSLPLCVAETKQTAKWKRPFYENIAPRSFDAKADGGKLPERND